MGADTGWSRAGISAAMTFAFLSMGVAGFAWGALTDRLRHRYGSYAWMYIASFAIGLAAVSMAFLFPRASGVSRPYLRATSTIA